MAADQLVRGAIEALGEPELALLAEELEAEDRQEREVSELLGDVSLVTRRDRLARLDRLLGDVGRHALERLRPVPGAAVRPAEPAADAHKLRESLLLAFGHERSIAAEKGRGKVRVHGLGSALLLWRARQARPWPPPPRTSNLAGPLPSAPA